MSQEIQSVKSKIEYLIYIQSIQQIDADGGLARYRLKLVPGVWLTTQARRNRVFQNKPILQVIEEVLAPYAPYVRWQIDTGVDTLLADLAPRPMIVQYQESDYAFITRLLGEEGLGWGVTESSASELLPQRVKCFPTVQRIRKQIPIERLMNKIILLLCLSAFQVYASDASKKSNIKVITTIFNSTNNSEPDYAKYEPMHCEPIEEIVFNCSIGKKILSICAFPKNGPYKFLEYRYGTKGKVEMRYTATHSNKNRFYSFIEPLNPKASVSGIWFSRGNTDYVISECAGGDCPVESGLVVLKNGKVVSRGKQIFTKACNSNIYGERNAPFFGHAYINPKIVEFVTDDPKSNTSLVLDDESRIGVDDLITLYPYSGKLY